MAYGYNLESPSNEPLECTYLNYDEYRTFHLQAIPFRTIHLKLMNAQLSRPICCCCAAAAKVEEGVVNKPCSYLFRIQNVYISNNIVFNLPPPPTPMLFHHNSLVT